MQMLWTLIFTVGIARANKLAARMQGVVIPERMLLFVAQKKWALAQQ